jgi:GNAT superfamily N-acetyltransferase
MISQGIDVRSAIASDAEAVTDLLMAQLHEHGIGTPHDAVREAVDGMLADYGRGFVLIAEHGSRIVGVAYVSFTWTLEHGGRSAWLEELYVVPDERNRGVGRAMLAVVLRNASTAGCAAVDLEVDTTHARAWHLYAREGFTPLPRARWVRTLAAQVEHEPNPHTAPTPHKPCG